MEKIVQQCWFNLYQAKSGGVESLLLVLKVYFPVGVGGGGGGSLVQK